MKAVHASMTAVLLISCGHTPIESQDDAVRGVSEAVVGMYAAFQTHNLAKVGEYMTEGSTCVDEATCQMLVGRKAVLDHFGAILAQHKPSEKWEPTITDLRVVSRGDIACATYHVNTSQGGGHALAAVTHVFQKIDGRWLAIHLHRSWIAMPK